MHNLRPDASEQSVSCGLSDQSLLARTDMRGGCAAEPTDQKALLAARLVVSSALVLESQGETHVTVVNRTSAARLKLSRVAYQFLLGFRSPHTIEEVFAGEPPSGLMSQVRMLIDKGMLIDADAQITAGFLRQRTAVPYKFCNAPRLEKFASPANFVVLGVPYDLGGRIDCRLAPSAVRQKSLDFDYQLQFDTGRPQGWFDANRGVRILEGAVIADAGDVYIEYGENQRDLFARIGDAVEDTCTPATVPVILGGDRSVTYATVKRLQSRRPLAVVQFAMEPAMGATVSTDVVNANDIGRRLLQLRGVEKFASFGGSDDVTSVMRSESVVIESACFLRQHRPEEIAHVLGNDLALHISIDLGVVISGRVTRDETKASHLALHEIKEMIRALGAAHRIISIDLVGLDTRREPLAVSTVIACHLLLTAMSAAYDRF